MMIKLTSRNFFLLVFLLKKLLTYDIFFLYKIIKGDLEVLKMLYLMEEKLYKELSQTKQTILIKDNRGVLNNITTAIIFALGYKNMFLRYNYKVKMKQINTYF